MAMGDAAVPLLNPLVDGDAVDTAPRKGSKTWADEAERHSKLWIGAQGKASGSAAFNNLTKAFLGAASFELPWALKQSGIGAGIVSLVVFACTCAYTLKILGRMRVMVMKGNGCSSTYSQGCAVTYVEIGRAAYGTAGAGCPRGVRGVTDGRAACRAGGGASSIAG